MNTVGEINGQNTSFWPKVLPIGLTVAHLHHFSPILASIWLKSVAHWSHPLYCTKVHFLTQEFDVEFNRLIFFYDIHYDYTKLLEIFKYRL